MRAALLHSYAGAGRSGIFIRSRSAPVRPLTALQHHCAGLPPVRGRAPPLDLIGFCNLAHLTIVSTSETSRNQYRPAHSREMSAATGKSVQPMLATLGRPLTGECWAFESKWDGTGWVRRFSSASRRELAVRAGVLTPLEVGFAAGLHGFNFFRCASARPVTCVKNI